VTAAELEAGVKYMLVRGRTGNRE